MDTQTLFEFLLRQGDNALILGQRLSEWCGTGPTLEEDIALANTALDLIGQTQLWLACAAEAEGAGRSANDLAFLRDSGDFRCLLMLELPNKDYARTMMRQFLFDAFQVPWLTELQASSDQRIADIAAKSLKEALYHLERSTTTLIALGDGTAQSNAFMQEALDEMWAYTGEMFVDDEIDTQMYAAKMAPLPSQMRANWQTHIERTLDEAHLNLPQSDFAHKGGRNGVRHTEHLGHMLATMQILQRSYPGASW